MTVDVMSDAAGGPCRLQPFALREAPALIEAVFPAQKVSFARKHGRKNSLTKTQRHKEEKITELSRGVVRWLLCRNHYFG